MPRGQVQQKDVRDLGGDIQSLVKTLVTKICASEEFVDNISQSISTAIGETFEQRIASLETENEKLKEELSKEVRRVDSLSREVGYLERHLSSKALRLYGVLEQPKEQIVNVVMQLINSRLAVKVSEEDLEECFRIGKSHDGKPRAIYIRLTTSYLRRQIYKHKSGLKGSKAYLREQLTGSDQSLVKLAVSKYGGRNVWTDNGLIFAKVDDKVICRIRSREDLVEGPTTEETRDRR